MGMFGSPQCQAPEVRKGATYNTKADTYSLGIILYYMIFQELPAEPLKEPGKIIRDKLFKLTIKYSNNLYQVLIKLLDPDENSRISAAALLKHDFILGPVKVMKTQVTELEKRVEDKIYRATEWSGVTHKVKK